jgi:hypothetical protein
MAGRPPIGKTAMTGAERARRHRIKQAAAVADLAAKLRRAEREAAKWKQAFERLAGRKKRQ